MKRDIGVVGLAVMGQNLVLNMNDHGFRVSVYNRTTSKVDDFLSGPARGTQIQGFTELPPFFESLTRPRRVMFMVKAGAAVDDLIQQSLPYLDKGDILIDGGNSYFADTIRRQEMLEDKGILYLGVGISGGEEGARYGPSIMPGGSFGAWGSVQSIFQSISAHVQGKDGPEPCCEWVGTGGAGHFVKMVHNGIEYGDMQLIAEVYDLLKRGAGCTNDELATIFSTWNRGVLESYLIEITAKIFAKKCAKGTGKADEYVVDQILDVAGQKGTGKWTVATALDISCPLTLITESLFCRYLSAMLEERYRAENVLGGDITPLAHSKESIIRMAEGALYAAKIVSYAQGFMLMVQASKEYGWTIHCGSCALMWRGGCIIRSSFLGKVKEAFDRNPTLEILMLDPYFASEIKNNLSDWRRVVASAVSSGIPVPCLSSALHFYDGLRSKRLPTNLIQAQRDFFGAHTFERIDMPRGQFFHEDWNV